MKQRNTLFHREDEKKNNIGAVMEKGNNLHESSFEEERWRHFTCWRMKVFIVAKMRATLQKQHRGTTVTQPDVQLLARVILGCTVRTESSFVTRVYVYKQWCHYSICWSRLPGHGPSSAQNNSSFIFKLKELFNHRSAYKHVTELIYWSARIPLKDLKPFNLQV